MIKHSIVVIWGLLVASGCATKIDYYQTPSFSETGAVNAVIEIPAGTNVKFEYDPSSKRFVIDQENGKDRVIDFLPYPANYGFIPATLSDKTKGGDGDALDVLVLSNSQKTGEIIEVEPIAILKLVDEGEQDYKIIAVPSNKKLKVIEAVSYADLQKYYPAMIEIIELWFLNYNKNDAASVEGWGNEKEALKEIRRAVKK